MEKVKKRARKSSIIYWTIVAVCMALMMSTQFVFAAEEVTLWSRFKDIMQDFYLKRARCIPCSTEIFCSTAVFLLTMTAIFSSSPPQKGGAAEPLWTTVTELQDRDILPRREATQDKRARTFCGFCGAERIRLFAREKR